LKQLIENQRLYLTAVLNYRLPLNEIVARLSGRRTCQGCKAVYHVTERPPRVAGICDRCGGIAALEDWRKQNSARKRV
jgi:adenylate kinase